MINHAMSKHFYEFHILTFSNKQSLYNNIMCTLYKCMEIWTFIMELPLIDICFGDEFYLPNCKCFKAVSSSLSVEAKKNVKPFVSTPPPPPFYTSHSFVCSPREPSLPSLPIDVKPSYTQTHKPDTPDKRVLICVCKNTHVHHHAWKSGELN